MKNRTDAGVVYEVCSVRQHFVDVMAAEIVYNAVRDAEQVFFKWWI